MLSVNIGSIAGRLSVFTALLFLAAAASPDVNVLLQMQAGKALCSNPDPATKTCSAIAQFARGPDGKMVETTELLISFNQPITVQMSAAVEVEGNRTCGMLELPNLQAGTVRVNGDLLPPDRNEAVLAKLIEVMKPMLGRRSCDAIVQENGQLLKLGQVDRVELALPGKPVAWVAPSDGYKVAPR